MSCGMQVTPIDSRFARTSGFEKRAMANTSLSGASMRSAGLLTGPCPPTNNTFWPCIVGESPSETEVEDRLVERRHVERLHSRQQPVVRQPREEPVDGPLEVGDVSLELFVQAHV